MVREKIEKVNGYCISKETDMEDLKAEHKTRMLIEEVKFDSYFPSDRFIKRYLRR